MDVYEYSKEYFGIAANGGEREEADITTVIIHDTEGLTAIGGARTLTTRPDASAHIVCDEADTYRLLNDLTIAWTQMWNKHALSIEQAGFALWSLSTWLDHIRTIRRAAYWAAFWCYRHQLPVRWLSVNDLNSGRIRGITSHRNVSLSKLSESTHTDPGLNYPYTGKTSFMALTKYYFGRFKLGTISPPQAIS